jgi:two-component system NarL family response regulator
MVRAPAANGTIEPTGDTSVTSILVVSDRVGMAQALRWVLEERGLGPVAIAGTPHEAIRALIGLAPAAALIDLDLPEIGGLVFGQRLRDRSPSLRLIGLAGAMVPDGLREHALRAGFDACPPARLPLVDLLDTIARVLGSASGSRPFWARDELESVDTPVGITSRELEVLELVARGATNSAIARVLEISPNTVRSHVQNIRAKLDAGTRLEAVWIARRRGILRMSA